MAYMNEGMGRNPWLRIGSVSVLHIALIWALAVGLYPPVIKPIPPVIHAYEVKGPKVIPKEPPKPTIVRPQVIYPEPKIEFSQANGGPDAITVSHGAIPPRALGHKQPDYPASARRMKQHGTVVMVLLVGLDGRVSKAQVETSSGYAILDEAAVSEALRSWQYAPGSEGGVQKPMWVKAQVMFRCGVNGCG